MLTAQYALPLARAPQLFAYVARSLDGINFPKPGYVMRMSPSK